MTVEVWQAFVIGVLIPLVGAIGGKDLLRRWLVSGQEREMTAQTAIIELAKDAIGGWHESTKAVTRLTDAIQTHGKESGLYYQSLKESTESQDERLVSIESNISSLVNILARTGRRKADEN